MNRRCGRGHGNCRSHVLRPWRSAAYIPPSAERNGDGSRGANPSLPISFSIQCEWPFKHGLSPRFVKFIVIIPHFVEDCEGNSLVDAWYDRAKIEELTKFSSNAVLTYDDAREV